jgi:hypothetical protein
MLHGSNHYTKIHNHLWTNDRTQVSELVGHGHLVRVLRTARRPAVHAGTGT